MAQVRMEKIRKDFGKVQVINGVDLAIPDGEFHILVGPSGCGKSTLLRLVAGLEETTSGSIFIGERLINEVAPKDRDIAMVFQNYALYPHMTVYENMAFGLKLRKVRKVEIDRKVGEAAEILGISDFLLRKPKELSGGQRQRVAMGRAIVREPAVFLFDEPLSNLDAKLRVQMRAEIHNLHLRLKTTTIYVTHDQAEAMTLGDRITLLERGVVQQIGSPLEIYNEPDNGFVAGFIGQMNFLPGVFLDESARHFVKIGPNKIILPEGRFEPSSVPSAPLKIGIRPEHFTIGIGADGYDTSLSVVVDFVETMGPELFVHTHVKTDEGDEKIVIKADPGLRVNRGQSLQITVQTDKMHIFSGENQRSLRKCS